MISIRGALALLATAVSYGARPADDDANPPDDVVQYALSLVPIDDVDLAALGCKRVRERPADCAAS